MTPRLDRQAFSSRFFAGRDRHDLQVLKAAMELNEGRSQWPLCDLLGSAEQSGRLGYWRFASTLREGTRVEADVENRPG